jgi:tetratricopeptide (TPR) repeat protein
MRQRIIAMLLASLLAAPAAAAGLDEVQAGNAAFTTGQFQIAVEAYTRGIQAGDLDADALAIAFNNRGVAFGELGDFDRAIRDYGEALRLRPEDKTSIKNLRIAHVRRGGAAAGRGDMDRALAEYSQAIQVDPNHPLGYLRRGQLLLTRGDTEGALSDLAAAERLDPSNEDVALLLDQAQQAEQASAAPAPPAAPAAAPPPSAITTTPPVVAAVPPPSPPAEPEPAETVEPAAGPAAPTPAAPAPAPAPPTSSAAVRAARSIADVNVRSGPGNAFPASGTLARGTEVEVLDERLGWLKVRLPDGREGYVYRKWLAASETTAAP